MASEHWRALRAGLVSALCVCSVAWVGAQSMPTPAAALRIRAQGPMPTPALLEAASRSVRGFDANDAGQVSALAFIEQSVFTALPVERQAEIAGAGLYNPGGDDRATAGPWDNLPKLGDEAFEIAKHVCSREAFDSMRPVHQRALVRLVERRLSGEEVAAFCFGPGTPQETIDAFDAAIFGPIGLRFQQTNRWSVTATNPGPLAQGQPTTLTYSFVPDGTSIPDGGFGPGISDLQAFLNARYSNNPATWKALYAQVLARWSQLGKVTYVLENNDDGSMLNTLPGALGVRGDLRFGGMALDGASNVLAYNYFPNDGDMVLDTSDTFFNNTNNSSRRLRNVLAHEHGHGLGMLHVCPINQTKLMEPNVTTSFDGPQFDDILNMQRHYGDTIEPNDTSATATVISNLSTTTNTIGQISIDDNGDMDYFRVDIAAAPRLLTVTARPLGTSYNETGQSPNGSCGAGTSFNPLTVNNLIVDLMASNGTSILATADVTGVGEAEVLNEVVQSTGTYYVRVRGGNINNIQGYQLEYRLTNGPATFITTPNGVPTTLVSGQTSTFNVRVQTLGETLVGTPQLNYRSQGSGAFTSVPMTLVSGDQYTATLPAFLCVNNPQFFLSAQSSSSGTNRVPTGTTNFSATLGTMTTIFSDDCEQQRGWTTGVVGDTASSGAWNWANPSGTTSSSVQVQPENTNSGSLCYFTGASGPGAAVGDADVDGGFTTLVSPTINCSGYADAVISYARWYTNSSGANPNQDTFRIDVSVDGGNNWVRGETVGPTGTGPGWVMSGFKLLDLGLTPTSQVVLRFIADDAEPGSIVEAAIDDVTVVGRLCSDPPPTGPCCLGGGQCVINTQAQCLSLNGAWNTQVSCTPNNCPRPTGSCCATSGDCTVTTQANCTGTWAVGAICEPNPCPQPTGSCCLASGDCSVTIAANCTTGTWTMFASCTPNVCPQPATGSCCTPTGTCTVTTEAECAGVWTADGECEPNPCPQPIGACCTGVSCAAITQAACGSTLGGGTYLGDNTVCAGGVGNPVTCCPANINGTDGVTADDIFAYLDMWFAQNGNTGSGHSADFNRDNSVSADDIFAFLDAWFIGCN